MEQFIWKNIIELNNKRYKYLNLEACNLGNSGAEVLAKLLNGVVIHEINLSNNSLDFVGVATLAAKFLGSQLRKIDLSGNQIGDEGLDILSNNLIGTNISSLNLYCSEVGNVGVKHLSEALKFTQITELNLNNNNISDEGAHYLSKYIRDSKLARLNIAENVIGPAGANYLNSAVKLSKLMMFHLEVYFTNADGSYFLGLAQNSLCGLRDLEIILKNNQIGEMGADYINNAYRATGITFLQLNCEILREEEVTHLSHAFDGVTINQFSLTLMHLMQNRGVAYLIKIFKNSTIFSLDIHSKGEPISAVGAELLARMLYKVNIIHLDLSMNFIRDDGMQFLAPALKNSGVIYINLTGNIIGYAGVCHLADNLRNSNLLEINLSNNEIGHEGVKYLMEHLLDSQVTRVVLEDCYIPISAYKYLFNVVDNTSCHITDDQKYPSIITKNDKVGNKIIKVFNKLVQYQNGEYKFVLPENKSPSTLQEYSFLIKTFVDNPNAKVHIFNRLCKIDRNDLIDFDIDKMSKINQFVNNISQKFIDFFNSSIIALYKMFDNVEYFVYLAMQFEEDGLSGIVRDLLLHREVYFVDCGDTDVTSNDGNEEETEKVKDNVDDIEDFATGKNDNYMKFLHPCIYLMLDKYNLHLGFNKDLEPQKRDEIIAYFQDHLDICGARDLILLLRTKY